MVYKYQDLLKNVLRDPSKKKQFFWKKDYISVVLVSCVKPFVTSKCIYINIILEEIHIK